MASDGAWNGYGGDINNDKEDTHQNNFISDIRSRITFNPNVSTVCVVEKLGPGHVKVISGVKDYCGICCVEYDPINHSDHFDSCMYKVQEIRGTG